MQIYQTNKMDIVQTFPKKLNLRYDLLCLDFTNTLIWRMREEPQEGFQDYSIFVKWSHNIGLLTDAIADRLHREAETHPDDAERVLRQAIALRETLYRILSETVEGRQPKTEDLELLNTKVAQMLQRTLLIQKDKQFEWGWKVTENALDQMLWPILRSATELLTSPELKRIGICKGEGCGWLFYDKSRNRSRKWCDMGDCGNRAKARRFYKRKRRKSSPNS